MTVIAEMKIVRNESGRYSMTLTQGRCTTGLIGVKWNRIRTALNGITPALDLDEDADNGRTNQHAGLGADGATCVGSASAARECEALKPKPIWLAPQKPIASRAEPGQKPPDIPPHTCPTQPACNCRKQVIDEFVRNLVWSTPEEVSQRLAAIAPSRRRVYEERLSRLRSGSLLDRLLAVLLSFRPPR